METMPKLVRPEDQSPEIDRFISVFGNRARLSIIRFLQANGPSLRIDISEALDMAKPTLGHHLAELEELGVLNADLPPERRRGRTVRYSVNQGAVDELLQAPQNYIFD